MRRRSGVILGFAVVCVLCVFALCGCGEEKSGQTISEPEITGEYLENEYSQQLLTDGADTVVGVVTIEQAGDNTYAVSIAEREVVANDDYKEGYYIADNNIVLDATLGEDARIACEGEDGLDVLTAKEFMAQQDENAEQLYTVYMMGDSAELIIATDPEDVEIE